MMSGGPGLTSTKLRHGNGKKDELGIRVFFGVSFSSWMSLKDVCVQQHIRKKA